MVAQCLLANYNVRPAVLSVCKWIGSGGPAGGEWQTAANRIVEVSSSSWTLAGSSGLSAALVRGMQRHRRKNDPGQEVLDETDVGRGFLRRIRHPQRGRGDLVWATPERDAALPNNNVRERSLEIRTNGSFLAARLCMRYCCSRKQPVCSRD